MRQILIQGGVLSCVCLFWVQYMGIVCFLYGFLPMKNPVGGYASSEDYAAFYKETSLVKPDIAKPKRMIGQLVFMVIDALRADFVFPFEQLNQTGLKFKKFNDIDAQDDYKIKMLTRLVSQRNGDGIDSVGMLAQVHSPTVTMPRIKALTTGSIPGFVDVLLNFGSKDLGQDSILEQWVKSDRKITMFGDDTWLGLFPKHFMRSDGTTSFFVSDYTEVDQNVTRHIREEMEKRDWDVSVLHYLGLDHIGHLSGPKSKLIPRKLDEMGNVIQDIVASLFRKPWKENLPPMIIVLGDHGMADAGGHGGSSLMETITPVVALFPSITASEGSERYAGSKHPPVIKQHDIASTLSLLTGVPIPKNNIGTFHWKLLSHFITKEEVEKGSHEVMCFYNLEQVLSCLKSQFSWYDQTDGYKHYLMLKKHLSDSKNDAKDAVKECENAIHQMSDVLEENMSSYNIKIMMLGVLILAINLTVFGKWYFKYIINDTNGSLFSIEGLFILFNILRLLSFGSTSYIEEEHQSVYFFTTSIGVSVLYFQGMLNANTPKKLTTSQLKKTICDIGGIVLVFLLLRMARTINQTGDKWLHLPDLSDYFQKPENHVKLTIAHALSVLLLIGVRIRRIKRWTNESVSKYGLSIVILVTAYLTIFIQKLSDETSTKFANAIIGSNEDNRKIVLAQLVYLYSFLYFVIRIYGAETVSNCCQVLLDSLLMVFSLLVQPYSACLLPIGLIIEDLMFNSMQKVCKDWGSVYYLYGLSTYFQMGNSNNIASVDVGAGYQGMPSYSPGIICLLMAVNTFNGPLLWALLLFCRLDQIKESCQNAIRKNDKNKFLKVERALKTIGFYRAFELLLVTVICTVCRYHIMVWTVFAPKLLYEMMFSLIMALLFTLVYVVIKLFVLTDDRKDE